MDLDPRDYDIGELRDAAGSVPEDLENDPFDGERSPAAFDSVEVELAFSEVASEGPTERPYLERVPDGYLAELLTFRWLEFLTGRAGVHGAMTALGYYRDLEWITADAESTLRDYMLGLGDVPAEAPGLAPEDHRTSLHFCSRLAALATD